MRFRLVQKSSTLDDLEVLQIQIFSEFCATLHFWEAATAKRVKIVPYYQQQKCSQLTLVSSNIRRMRIFAGVPLSAGDLDGYFFENVRDKANNIIRRYATPCRPLTDCGMNHL